MEETVSTTSESGIFNSKKFQKINRQGKPCIFSDKLSKNVTKYLFPPKVSTSMGPHTSE